MVSPAEVDALRKTLEQATEEEQSQVFSLFASDLADDGGVACHLRRAGAFGAAEDPVSVVRRRLAGSPSNLMHRLSTAIKDDAVLDAKALRLSQYLDLDELARPEVKSDKSSAPTDTHDGGGQSEQGPLVILKSGNKDFIIQLLANAARRLGSLTKNVASDVVMDEANWAYEMASVFWDLSTSGHAHLAALGLDTALVDAAVNRSVDLLAQTQAFQHLVAQHLSFILSCLVAMLNKVRALHAQQESQQRSEDEAREEETRRLEAIAMSKEAAKKAIKKAKAKSRKAAIKERGLAAAQESAQEEAAKEAMNGQDALPKAPANEAEQTPPAETAQSPQQVEATECAGNKGCLRPEQLSVELAVEAVEAVEAASQAIAGSTLLTFNSTACVLPSLPDAQIDEPASLPAMALASSLQSSTPAGLAATGPATSLAAGRAGCAGRAGRGGRGPGRGGRGGGMAPISSAAADMDELPPEIFCPITTEIMVDPVVTADGHTYERSAIVKWLLKKATSPLTGEPLAHIQLTPSHAMRAMCRKHLPS